MQFNSCTNSRTLRSMLMASVCFLVLITPIALASPWQSAPQNHAARDRWVATLASKRISLTFQHLPIAQALQAISKKTGVSIQGLWLDTPVGSTGIDPAITINLEMKDMRALEILEMIVRQANDSTQRDCRWQTTISGIEVGPKSRLLRAGALERRAYSVTDLGFKAPNFQAPAMQSGGASGGATTPPFTPSQNDARYQKLKLLIQSTVESDVWVESSGGPCTITVFDDKLIVIAPDFVHRAIAQSQIVPTNIHPTNKPTR